MTGDQIDSFIEEIRTSAKFMVAAANHPEALSHLLKMKSGLYFLQGKADEDHRYVDPFDRVTRALVDKSAPLKSRIDEVVEVLGQLHAAGRSIN